ncbi:MAG: DUF4012 domain-containing protein, partial [Dehalococcoidia bacterium]
MARVLARRWKLVLLAGVLLVVALGVWGAVRGSSGLRRLDRASIALRELEPRLEELQAGSLGSLTSLQSSVSQVAADLRKARSELTPFVQVSSLFGWVPRAGSRLRNAEDMLALGDKLVSAAEDLLTAADVVIASGSEGEVGLLKGDRLNEDALRSVAAQEPLFRSALKSLEGARLRLGRLEDRDLPQDFERLRDAARRVVPGLETLARTGLAFSKSWRSFLGYDGTRSYLLVAQNSDELRATGGFIPGAWLLTLDGGEIIELRFWDTVAI